MSIHDTIKFEEGNTFMSIIKEASMIRHLRGQEKQDADPKVIIMKQNVSKLMRQLRDLREMHDDAIEFIVPTSDVACIDDFLDETVQCNNELLKRRRASQLRREMLETLRERNVDQVLAKEGFHYTLVDEHRIYVDNKHYITVG